MRSRALALLLALLTLAPLATAGHGTYSGSLRIGELDAYRVRHPGPMCLDVITHWVVSLTYTPRDDVLTLAVAGYGSGASPGINGQATVRFTTTTSCAVFEVIVHGTVVKDKADYTLSIGTGGEPCTLCRLVDVEG